MSQTALDRPKSPAPTPAPAATAQKPAATAQQPTAAAQKPATPATKPPAMPQKAAATGAPSTPRPVAPAEKAQYAADSAVHGVLARHWAILGVPPTMDLADLETSFYVIVEKYSRNPTEEEEAKLQEMQQSYAILRRALEERPAVAGPRLELGEFTKRQRITACLAAVIGLVALSWFNSGTIKLHFTDLRPDTVLRLANQQEAYATVVRFDPAHQFAVGAPSRAYQLKLAKTEEMVWLSERVVEKGMVPMK